MPRASGGLWPERLTVRIPVVKTRSVQGGDWLTAHAVLLGILKLIRYNMQGPCHQPIGLYVHVPFCVRRCTYCDFATWAGREAEIPCYVDAVIREITRRGAETGHPKADTIFLGGGTPSLLDEFQLTRVLDGLFAAFPMEEGAEITCECNPETLTAPFAKAVRKAGVNRLSMGAGEPSESFASPWQDPRLGTSDRCRRNCASSGIR